jgi:hypothetical protein
MSPVFLAQTLLLERLDPAEFQLTSTWKIRQKVVARSQWRNSWLKAASNPAPKIPLPERDRTRMRIQSEIGGSKFYKQKEGATAFCTCTKSLPQEFSEKIRPREPPVKKRARNKTLSRNQGPKKTRPAPAGFFCLFSMIQLSTTASAAGTAAAGTAADGIRGTDRKTGPHARINKVNFYGTARGQQIIINEKCQPITIIGRIIFLWLIQSQSQRGARSPPLHQGDTQCRINFVLLHISLEVFNCQICYLYHPSVLLCKRNSLSPSATCFGNLFQQSRPR